eukprot:jgi/Botrbrau1/17968/Bobra.50_1s0057.3
MSLAATFPHLRTLDLTACCVPTAFELAGLRALRLLRHLSIQLPEFGVSPLLEEIAALRQLTSLDVAGSSSLTDDGLTALARHGRWQRLNLTDCAKISDFGLIMLAAGVSTLRVLIFPLINSYHFGPMISDTSVVALSLLPDLEELDLRNHQALGPRSLEALLQGPAGCSLQILRLANCFALCEQGLEFVSRLPNLTTLELSYLGTLPMWTPPLLAGNLHVLSRLTRLSSLNLAGANWEEADSGSSSTCMMALTRLSRLSELDVSCPGRRRVKETCRRLDVFPLGNLTALDMSRSGIDDEGIAPLAGATRLERLDCHECPFLTCSALPCLNGLANLRSLSLDDCDGLLPNGPESLAVLSNFTNLEELSWTNRNGGAPTWIASEVELSDDCWRMASLLVHVKHMPKLRKLHISRQSLDPVSSTLSMLSTATALEDLDLSGCFCDCPQGFNEALTAFSSLSRLSRLSLDSTPVDGSGLRAICSCATELIELDLSRTSLGDDDMEEVLHLPLLRTLLLDDQKSLAVGDQGLRHIARLPSLARLSLTNNCDITSIGLKALGLAARLTSLDLSGSVDVNVAQALRSLQSCRMLSELAIGDPGGVSRMGLCVVPKAVHCLEVASFRASLPYLRKFSLGSQVRQVSSMASYAVVLLQAGLQAFVLETVHLCVQFNNLCRSAVASLRQEDVYAMPFGAALDGPSASGDLSSALEKDEDDFPQRFFWSGTLVMG